jgi:hypothetical protein
MYQQFNNNQGGPRQMFDVSSMGLTCAHIGDDGVRCPEAITELPFMPRADKPVFCKKHRPKPMGPRRDGGNSFGGGSRY